MWLSFRQMWLWLHQNWSSKKESTYSESRHSTLPHKLLTVGRIYHVMINCHPTHWKKYNRWDELSINFSVYLRCYWQGGTVDTEHLSELTEEEYEVNYVKPDLRGFMKINTKYLIPFFTRRFTNQVRAERTRWHFTVTLNIPLLKLEYPTEATRLQV